MVTLLKSLHPLLSRIPAPLPIPGSESFWMPTKGDTKLETQRKETYSRADEKRLDKTAAPFWLERLTLDETRRSRS